MQDRLSEIERRIAELEADDPPSAIGLRDYFERLIKEHAKQHFLEEQARILQAQNLNTRLESMNEFRNQMRDQTTSFVTREVVESQLTSIVDRINKIELAKARLDGSLLVAVGLVTVITSIATAILVKLWRI